jgi:CDP-6-deoxy-D-xylo-4-hexulose-3-dehydrase
MVETEEFTADELIRYLEEHKVSTRRVFAGNIMKQPGYNLPHITFGTEGSDRIMRDMFWIGCHPALTKEMLDYVVEVFDKFFKEKKL